MCLDGAILSLETGRKIYNLTGEAKLILVGVDIALVS